jgi:MFS family permease
MFSEMLSDKFRVTARSTITNIVLVTNAFVWYYLAIKILYDIVNVTAMDSLLVWGIHFSGITFSAIAGASLARKVGDRTRFLTFWMALGVVSSVVAMAVDISSVPSILILSLLLGVSLGLGMPSCMGYFTENMKIQNRGRSAGIIILISGLTMAGFGTIAAENIGVQTAILSAWRIIGLAVFLLLKPPNQSPEKAKAPSYRSMFNQRSFILYLVPWVMFSLITYLTIPIQTSIIGSMQLQMTDVPSVEFLRGIENILTGIFAVVGGLLSDVVGRKRMAIAGFAMLGLGYSVLGIYPETLVGWYFYTVVDGIAWGMLFVIFVVTVWGELSHHVPSDKYYAVGVAPFFISKALQFTIGNNVADAIPTSAIFSFTAFFLFLAVLPLVYAPETLPDKIMKDRELKNYIEKAQKEVEKAQRKEEENCESDDEDDDVEIVANEEEFEEILKKAEQYY